MMMRAFSVVRSLCLVSLGLLLLTTAPSHAMTVVPRDFEALVARAETIFRGTVTGQESLWVGEGRTRRIVTRITFRAEETLKGEARPAPVLQFLGGTVGDETQEIVGMPRFAVGENAVLFVVNNGKQMCPLVGAYQGRFRVQTAPGDPETRVYTHDRAPVTDTAELGQLDANGAPRLRARLAAGNRNAGSEAPALGYPEFRRRILERLADRAARGAPLVERDLR